MHLRIVQKNLDKCLVSNISQALIIWILKSIGLKPNCSLKSYPYSIVTTFKLIDKDQFQATSSNFQLLDTDR